jgi:DNA-binding response OmpR family regulator
MTVPAGSRNPYLLSDVTARRQGANSVAQAASVESVSFPDPADRTPTILVVEDEVLIRIALSDYLQECGFKVLEAGNAEDAIEILESSSIQIDLIFSDVVMPGKLDGFGLARWLRTNRPGLPILLTSGDAGKAETARKLCENEPFLAKPYDLKHVVARIRASIEGTKKNTT